MKIDMISKDEIRGVGYEIPAEYVRGSEKNSAYWAEIDFSKFPPYPADLKDEGELATWKHPADEKVKLAYYFGCISSSPVPEGFTEFTITAGDYAVITASETVGKEAKDATVAKVRAASKEFFDAWLPASDYQYDLTKGMIFELYQDDKAYIYVPVAKK